MPSSKRDQLIEAALKTFYKDGFHATGVDKVIEEAGVARMTLYKHFKSKDQLILATLRRRDEEFRNSFMRTVERAAPTPRERLLAIYDTLQDWFKGKYFSGCMFINASAEYGDRDNPIHRAAAEHKNLILAYVTQLATDAGAEAPEKLAHGLMFLMEGSIVMAYVADDLEAAERAKQSAEALMQQAGI
jgi:AcrR family transcriptional regulator